jgi:hypothetical protein
LALRRRFAAGKPALQQILVLCGLPFSGFELALEQLFLFGFPALCGLWRRSVALFDNIISNPISFLLVFIANRTDGQFGLNKGGCC